MAGGTWGDITLWANPAHWDGVTSVGVLTPSNATTTMTAATGTPTFTPSIAP